jgi:hypothetical protein
MIDEKYVEQPPKYVEQPPKKKGHKKLWIGLLIGSIVFLLLAIVLVVVSAPSTTSTVQPQQSTSQQTAPAPKKETPQVQPQQQSPVVGKPYDTGDWQVTVNGTSTSMGSDFEQAKAGNQYLVVHVTLKNTSGSVQMASSLGMWSLKDSTGQTYTETFLSSAKSAPDGKVAVGGTIAGDLVYEVPANQHTYTIQFTPDLGSDTLIEWNLNI